MGAFAGLIVGGLCILAVVGGVSVIVSSIKKGINRATRGSLGTIIELGKALSQMDPKELNAEPGPKSISAMTSLLLPQISRDFPNFELHEAKTRAENVLTTYLSAVTQQNVEILSEGTRELERELENIISNLQFLNQREVFENVRIHETQISQYRKTAGKCIITFQMAVEYYRYKMKDSGTVVSGSKENKVQTRYNVDMIYVQDREIVDNEMEDAKGLNCPNCGAPLKMLGAKSCSYCGAPVVEYNIHVWNFCNVEEKIRA